MLAISHNDGLVTLVLPDQHARQAIALFQTALADSKIKELAQDAPAAAPAPEKVEQKIMNHNYPDSVKYMSAEKAGDEIVRYVMDKAEKKYGERFPFQMQRFFRALEGSTGVNLTREHKRRLIGSGRPHMRGQSPLRKIDTAIEVIGAEKVYKFAKSFDFVVNS